MYSVILLNFRGTSFLLLNLTLWHGFFLLESNMGKLRSIIMVTFYSYDQYPLKLKNSHISHISKLKCSHTSLRLSCYTNASNVSVDCDVSYQDMNINNFYVDVVMHVLRYHVLHHKVISLSIICLPQFPHFSHCVHSKF